MPIAVTIRAVPMKDGDSCPVFNPAIWWQGWDLMKDPRFRVIDPACYYSVGCLDVEDMRELQERYRPPAAGLDHWQRDSDRLDNELRGAARYGRWWVVTVYEWESGVD